MLSTFSSPVAGGNRWFHGDDKFGVRNDDSSFQFFSLYGE